MTGEKLLQSSLVELGLTVAADVEAQLLAFLDELLRWNRSINLTAITDRDEAIVKHLVDALTLLPHLGASGILLDMGSGGGIPGLVVAMARPDLVVTSIDAVAKKIAFQNHAIRTYGLSARALHGRLEELGRRPELNGRFTIVTARAFASLDDCLRLARPFLQPGGRLIAMKGSEGKAELAAAGAAVTGHGYVVDRVETLALPQQCGERTLLIFQLSE